MPRSFAPFLEVAVILSAKESDGMIMTYEAFDTLTERLAKIENSDPNWLPEQSEVEERLNMECEADVLFLLWLSLTMAGATVPEDAVKRQTVMRKLYDTVVLTD